MSFRKLLILSILIITIPLVNNCSGASSVASGANTGVVVSSGAKYGYSAYRGGYGVGRTTTALVVGTGSNAGKTGYATVYRWGSRAGTVIGGAMSGAFVSWF